MADRVPATIRLGGALPRALLPDLLDILSAEALTTEDGGAFEEDHIPADAAIEFSASEVSWGRFEQLEDFCLEHHLPFVRWCGTYPGGWTAERLVYDGIDEPVSFTATDNDLVVITEQDARALECFEAIEMHFAQANFLVPPLIILEPDAPPGPMVLRQRAYPDEVVPDLAGASQLYCTLRDASGHGASRFADGVILVDGRPVARISFNGRIWPPGPWDVTHRPLYDNSDAAAGAPPAAQPIGEQADG